MTTTATRSDLSLNIVVLLEALVASFTSGVWFILIAIAVVAMVARLVWRAAASDTLFQSWALMPTTCIVIALLAGDHFAATTLNGNLVFVAIAATFGPATASFYLAGRSPGLVLAGGLVTGLVGCGLFALMVTRTTLGKLFFPLQAILRADPLHWTGAARDPAIRVAETLVLACWDSLLIALPFALAGLIVCVPVALWLDRR